MEATIRFLLTGNNIWFVCIPLVLICVFALALRIRARFVRAKKRKADDKPVSFWDFWRDPYR
jgi:hypothetical protein